MRTVTVSREIGASRQAVWDVLADFPNIADWNSGITKSYGTSESTQGVGAKRHCDLAPMGQLEETVADWVDSERMVVSIDSAAKLPIKRGLATFTLTEAEQGTQVGIDYDYEPRFGVIGSVMGSAVDRQLTKGFTGFLKDLDTAATAAGTPH